jgi:hypothetical protein
MTSEPISGARRSVPLGFAGESQFLLASRQLLDALRIHGIHDAVIGVRGSSVVGHNVTTGTRFGASSDIDYFVVSAQLTRHYAMSKRIAGFVHPKKIQSEYPLIRHWASDWSAILGRKVTLGAFPPGMLPDQPAILVKP